MEMVKLLSKYKPNINLRKESSNHVTPILQLINTNFDKNKKFEIFKAMINGSDNVKATFFSEAKNILALLSKTERYNWLDVFFNHQSFDPNFKNSKGHTPLMWVSYYSENPELIKNLIKRGARVNEKDKKGATALHFAASTNFLKNIEVLVKAGSDLYIVGNFKENTGTPIDIAKKFGKTETYNYLVDIKKQKEEENLNFIKYAQKGDLKEVSELMDKHVDINYQEKELGFTALMRAAQGNKVDKNANARKIDILKLLLKREDLNKNLRDYTMKYSALRWAKESDNQEAAKLLIDAGATE
jgi:serine/threonine-protein phosphatase 6 regulatory ankyrin repeat subunit B